MTDPALPGVPVEIELSSAFQGERGPRLEQARVAAQTRLERTMAELGIPGRVASTLTVADGTDEASQPMSVTVDGRRCRYPDDLIGQLGAVTLGTHAAAGRAAAVVADEVRLSEDEAALPHFIACACEEIVKVHASWLLGDRQTEAFAERLWTSYALSRTEWPLERLAPLLRGVLELWIPISNAGRLVSALLSADGDPFERTVAALRATELHIEAPAWLLRGLTEPAEAPDSNRLASFDELRQGVYEDLGVRLPSLRFSPVDADTSTVLRFRVNALRTAPVLGLAPEELLVHLYAESVEESGVEAVPAWNPWLGTPGAIVDASAAPALSEPFTWDSWEYLLRVLDQAAHLHAAKLVDATTLELDLGVLRRDCPELVSTTRSGSSVDEIVATLRVLLAEQVPVRDLPRILRTAAEWHDAAYVPRPRLRSGYEPASDDLPAFLRLALAGQIAQQLAVAHSDALVCHVADRDTESMLTTADPLPEEDRLRFLRAVRAGIGRQPASAAASVVLTSAAARVPALAAIHDELPRVAVLAFDELPAQVMVDFRWLQATA